MASDKNTPMGMGHIYTILIDVLYSKIAIIIILYNNIKLLCCPEKDCHNVENIFKMDENRNKIVLLISK